MEKIYLKTWKDVEKLIAPDPSGKQVIHWTQNQNGFGIQCSGISTAKSFIIQKNVDGKTQRETLGPVEKYLSLARKTELDLSEAETALTSVPEDPEKIAKVKEARIKAKFYKNPLQAALDDGAIRLAQIAEDARKGQDTRVKVKAKISTLAEALKDYIENKKGIGERTKTFYNYMIPYYFKPWLNRNLSSITPKEIVGRLGEIKNEIAERRKEKIDELLKLGKIPSNIFRNGAGAGTSDLLKRTLRAIWRRAGRDNETIPKWNPADFEDAQEKIKPRKTIIEAAQLKDFLAKVNSKNESGEYAISQDGRDFVLLALFTGMRCGNVLGLQWSHVDFTSCVLKRSLMKMKGNLDLQDLPISDYVVDVLRTRYINRVDKETDWVFPVARAAKTQHWKNPKFMLRKLGKLCGFPLNAHKFRYTYITISEHCAISNDRRMALAGHKGNSITGDYTQIQVSDLRDPAQKVTDKFFEYAGIKKIDLKVLDKTGT